MRRIVTLLAALAGLALVQTAGAVGPSLPALDTAAGIGAADGTSYVARLAGSTTRLQAKAEGRVLRTASLPGRWGIQMATLGGTLTGLSPNGAVLVLSDNVQPGGALRTSSHFAVVGTRKLALRDEIALRGDYSVDALSPDGTLLYLIHHLAVANATKYQVVAYDLKAGRLLPGVIADKRQAGWLMSGYPMARAVTADGGWVYTLYRPDGNYPFIHALDTVHHTAVCIGLPASWTTDGNWVETARLELGSDGLQVQTKDGKVRFLLDTTTFRLTTP
jgi:hypothetical protein